MYNLKVNNKGLPDVLFAVQDGENGASLPAVLADICNNLWLLPSVCQGFVYDEFTGIASFLGQDKDQLIELSKQPQTCNRPGSSLWLLNAGMTTPTLALFVTTLQNFGYAYASTWQDQLAVTPVYCLLSLLLLLLLILLSSSLLLLLLLLSMVLLSVLLLYYMPARPAGINIQHVCFIQPVTRSTTAV